MHGASPTASSPVAFAAVYARAGNTRTPSPSSMEEIFPLPLVTNDLSAMLLTTIGNCSKENSRHLAMVQNAAVYCISASPRSARSAPPTPKDGMRTQSRTTSTTPF
ncbi:unnamed protein product, partial [Pylaiella littoralis]